LFYVIYWFLMNGIRTREGFGVKKQCRTLFLAKRAERTKRGRIVCKAKPKQTENPSLSAIENHLKRGGFLFYNNI